MALAIISITANGAEYNIANSVVTLNNFSLDAPVASTISGSSGALEGESANITGLNGSIAVYNVPEGFNATELALELLDYEEPYMISGWPGFWSWTNTSMTAFALVRDDQMLQVKIESDPATIEAVVADLKVRPATEVVQSNETTPSNETANVTESNATELNATNATESNEIIEKKVPSENPTASVVIGKKPWDRSESEYINEEAAKRAEKTHDDIRAVQEELYNKGYGKVCTGGDC